jgi:hypothetical protein
MAADFARRSAEIDVNRAGAALGERRVAPPGAGLQYARLLDVVPIALEK